MAGTLGLEPRKTVLETAGLHWAYVPTFLKDQTKLPAWAESLDETKTTLRPSRHNSPPHPFNPDGYGSDVFVEGLSHLYALIHL